MTVNGKMLDPTLELVNANGVVMRSNDNWRAAQQVEIEATGVPPGNDKESALVETLTPGNYTATLRGVDGATGVAVVEVYALKN